MKKFGRRAFCAAVSSAALAVTGVLTLAGPAQALEVGEPAPEFNLPATSGTDVALKDFRGKRWVLLEFYGADFAPT